MGKNVLALILVLMACAVLVRFLPPSVPGPAARDRLRWAVSGIALGDSREAVLARLGPFRQLPGYRKFVRGESPSGLSGSALGFDVDEMDRVISLYGNTLEKDAQIVLRAGASLGDVRAVLGQPGRMITVGGRPSTYVYPALALTLVFQNGSEVSQFQMARDPVGGPEWGSALIRP